jgi:protein Tex
LAHRFVNDAREVVKTGDIVKVRVTEVDLARKRIALTMKLDAPATGASRRDGPRDNRFEGAGRGQRAPQPQPLNTAMAGALAKLQGLRK